MPTLNPVGNILEKSIYDQTFQIFLNFLKHTTEKKLTSSVLKELFVLAAKRIKDSNGISSPLSFKMLDVGCGEGSLPAALLKSLDSLGFNIIYQGIDNNEVALQKAKLALSKVLPKAHIFLHEKDFEDFFNTTSSEKFDLILISHASYYADKLPRFIKLVQAQISEDGVSFYIHAPSFSSHSQLRGGTPELFNVPQDIEQIIEDTEFELITLPVPSFITFNTNLAKLKNSIKEKLSLKEEQDKELLRFIFHKKIGEELSKEEIERVQSQFINNNNIQIWAYIQIVGCKGNAWFTAIQQILTEFLDNTLLLNPLHFAAYEGRKEVYIKVQDEMEKIYASSSKSGNFQSYKPGVATPLYMAVLGWLHGQNKARHLDTVVYLKDFADDSSRSWALALISNIKEDVSKQQLLKVIFKTSNITQDLDYLYIGIITKIIEQFSDDNASIIADQETSDGRSINQAFLNNVFKAFLKDWLLSKSDRDLKKLIYSNPPYKLALIQLINTAAGSYLFHEQNVVDAQPLLSLVEGILRKVIVQELQISSEKEEFSEALGSYLSTNLSTIEDLTRTLSVFYIKTIYYQSRIYFYIKEKSLKKMYQQEAKVYFRKCIMLGKNLDVFEAVLAKARGIGYLLMDEKRYEEVINLYITLMIDNTEYIKDGSFNKKIAPATDLYFQIDSSTRIADAYRKWALETIDYEDSTAKLHESLNYLLGNTTNGITGVIDITNKINSNFQGMRSIVRAYNSLGNTLLAYHQKNMGVSHPNLKTLLKVEAFSSAIELAESAFIYAKEQSEYNDYTKAKALYGLVKVYELYKLMPFQINHNRELDQLIKDYREEADDISLKLSKELPLISTNKDITQFDNERDFCVVDALFTSTLGQVDQELCYINNTY